MLNDDPLYLIRLQAMSAADHFGSVALACRVLDIPRSTFYRWRRQWLLYGRDILRPRERRSPRMPNATPPLVEEQILAFALGHPAQPAVTGVQAVTAEDPPDTVGRDRDAAPALTPQLGADASWTEA